MMMVTRNKQHLSNIWSWIHEKVKQHWIESVACKKTIYFQWNIAATGKQMGIGQWKWNYYVLRFMECLVSDL